MSESIVPPFPLFRLPGVVILNWGERIDPALLTSEELLSVTSLDVANAVQTEMLPVGAMLAALCAGCHQTKRVLFNLRGEPHDAADPKWQIEEVDRSEFKPTDLIVAIFLTSDNRTNWLEARGDCLAGKEIYNITL